jgi:hypothetical protein
MSTKEIKEFTSKLKNKSKTSNEPKKTMSSQPPKFPDPFFENDVEYMKGFKKLMNKFQLEYETFNLNFLVERIKHLHRKENSIKLFNEQLRQDLALILNKNKNASTKEDSITINFQQNHNDNHNERSSQRLRRRRTNDANSEELSSGSFSLGSTSILHSNVNKHKFSYTYNLRSSKIKSAISFSNSTLTETNQVNLKTSKENSSLLVKVLKHSFINSIKKSSS